MSYHSNQELRVRAGYTYFAMVDRILKAFIGKLALITRSVPDLSEERVPRRAVCLVEDVCCAPTIIEL